MKAETHIVDLRKILETERWRASDELIEKMHKPLARQSAKVVNLNEWIAAKTRKGFGVQCQTE